MGGGVDETGALNPCAGDDVIIELNGVFADPNSAKYKYAQGHNNFGMIKNVPDNYQDLIRAYEAAGVPVSPRWAAYLKLLGKAASPGQGAQNIYDIAQIRYHGLIDGVIMLTTVHLPTDAGRVRTIRGSKGGIHSSIDSPCPMP
jgi:hypothetical protein